MKRLFFLICSLTTIIVSYGQEFLNLPAFNSGKIVWIARAGIGFDCASGSNIDTQKAQWDYADWNGSFKASIGFDFTAGFNKSFGNSPLYWGMELGIGTRGYKTSAEWEKSNTSQISGALIRDYHRKTQENTLTTYNARISPFIIGYKYTFKERMAADIHLGVYGSYDFSGNYKTFVTDHIVSTSKYGDRDDYTEDSSKVKFSDLETLKKFDLGINLGIGYWFGHFNIDLTWQRGFIPIYKNGSDDIKVGKKTYKRGDLYSNNFTLKLGYAF